MNEDPKKWIYYAVPIAVAVALAGALYYGKRHKEQETAPATVAEEPIAPAVDEPVHHPIETPPSEEPLPTLAESDEPLQQSLREIFGAAVDRYLVPKDIVRRFVVTIDNLPRKKTAIDRWPVKPLGGEFRTSGTEDIVLSPANAERYKIVVQLFVSTDTQRLVALYKRFYPLLQQAYVDLGYPEGYFNNRLIEVIDHLLETPEIEGPIRLVQPGVFYEFADPSLESRSSGQKLLLRMGNENAAEVKLKLREIRREIAQRDR
jgi:hypothetical protein